MWNIFTFQTHIKKKTAIHPNRPTTMNQQPRYKFNGDHEKRMNFALILFTFCASLELTKKSQITSAVLIVLLFKCAVCCRYQEGKKKTWNKRSFVYMQIGTMYKKVSSRMRTFPLIKCCNKGLCFQPRLLILIIKQPGPNSCMFCTSEPSRYGHVCSRDLCLYL